MIAEGFHCRLCGEEAAYVCLMDKGCACYPDDRVQLLCAQHAQESEPLGSFRSWPLAEQPGEERGPITSPFLLRAADRLAAECERAVTDKRIDPRSTIGDAVLDYREIRDDPLWAEQPPRQGETPDCNCASRGMLEGTRHGLNCPYGKRLAQEFVAEQER